MKFSAPWESPELNQTTTPKRQQNDNPYGTLGHANPYRSGVADAIMGRPSQSPWTDFPRQLAYVKGYLYGKELLAKQLED